MLSFLLLQIGTLRAIFALPATEAFCFPEVFCPIFITATMTLCAAFIVVDAFLDMLFSDNGS
jgi:hypothetical protein